MKWTKPILINEVGKAMLIILHGTKLAYFQLFSMVEETEQLRETTVHSQSVDNSCHIRPGGAWNPYRRDEGPCRALTLSQPYTRDHPIQVNNHIPVCIRREDSFCQDMSQNTNIYLFNTIFAFQG